MAEPTLSKVQHFLTPKAQKAHDKAIAALKERREAESEAGRLLTGPPWWNSISSCFHRHYSWVGGARGHFRGPPAAARACPRGPCGWGSQSWRCALSMLEVQRWAGGG